jgi:glyceraldehyde-3-phosphate dehydrogenase/erythrose-4-phosphate dehydrogenase
MSIKLAINGFGRIGRLAFRRAYEKATSKSSPSTIWSMQEP